MKLFRENKELFVVLAAGAVAWTLMWLFGT
jgi:hypothetical protein